MIEEYIFGKLGDFGTEKVKGWLNGNEAQKLLLKCFSDYSENHKGICYVDKEAILSVDGYKIKPNLRPEKIIEGIENIFRKCILTENTYEIKRIELEIVYNYLKEANKELLTLCHIDEDIHAVQDEVLENREVSKKHQSEISKKIEGIHSTLKNSTEQPILYFIEELNNSRIYCYIILKVSKKVDDDLLKKIEEMCGAECEQYIKDGLHHISIDFVEPLFQRDLRSNLEELDELFSDNDIGILGILTHQ